MKSDNPLGIVPVATIKENRTFVFYGRPGTGKTTLASTFPKPLLLLDIRDRGTDSVADVPDVYVKQVHSTADVEDIYWHLYDNPGKYKTVVFDTITNLQQVRIDEELERKKKKVRIVNFGTFSRKEWGAISADLKVFIQDFRDLPLEVVFICQDRTTIPPDEDTDDEQMIVPEIGPRAIPSVSSLMNSLVSVIGNTYIREKEFKRKDGTKGVKMEYALRLGPNSVYVTKIRNPRSIKQPERLTNPVYKDIIDAINGVE
jgi:hypothetical protein